MTDNGAIDYMNILWITAGLGCDGDTIAITAATQPSLEDLLEGILPGVPTIGFHNPVLSPATAEDFLTPFRQAARGEGPPFILVLEGSVPDERLAGDGYWAALGIDPATGDPIPTCQWLQQLAPRAWAVVGAGTCAAYGGVHAMDGNPTGCMGLSAFLGADFRSASGLPVVNVPGCPVQPDNFMETLLQLLRHAAGRGPRIALDEQGRPESLFALTVHEGCARGGSYEQAQFAESVDDPRCIVRQGCWGPVVQCNVGKRAWVNGVGGCANVGGICIGCTMPGFPDKVMPFMDQPPGSRLSSEAIGTYGASVRTLRRFTQDSLNRSSGRGAALPPAPPAAAGLADDEEAP